MIGIGRICVKIAGRDAGKKCIVVDVLDDNYVLIDGETRRRKCNIAHLEPLDKSVDIKKNASHADVTKAFEALGYGVHTSKPKKATKRPMHARKSKLAKAPATAAPTAKAVKPATPAKTAAAAKPAAEKKPRAPRAKKTVEEKKT